jgi:Cyanobacterial TRADD-N associated 2-Transmembrane domain
MDSGVRAPTTDDQANTTNPYIEQLSEEGSAPANVEGGGPSHADEDAAVGGPDIGRSRNGGIGSDTFASYEPAAEPLEEYMWKQQRIQLEYEHFQAMERRRSWQYLFVALGVLVAGPGSVLGLFLMLDHKNHHPLAGAMAITGSCLVAIVIIVGGKLIVAQKTGPPQTGAMPSRRKEDILDERTLNQQSLKKYHDLTQQQAGSSYLIAQVAILIGLLLLIGAGVVIIKASAPTTQIVVGALAVVGSTLSGYVGATSIRMYNRAQAQMNFYYAQPLVQSYILEAERISNCLSSGRKDSALEKVIAQTLEGAAVAGYLISRGGDEALPSRRGAKSGANRAARIPSSLQNPPEADD